MSGAGFGGGTGQSAFPSAQQSSAFPSANPASSAFPSSVSAFPPPQTSAFPSQIPAPAPAFANSQNSISSFPPAPQFGNTGQPASSFGGSQATSFAPSGSANPTSFGQAHEGFALMNGNAMFGGASGQPTAGQQPGFALGRKVVKAKRPPTRR
jgi:hypothetical protein